MREEKGITLVALVITVIIIIILATLTINMAFGDSGLITQAQRAKDMTLNSVVAEQEGMNSVLSEYLNVMEEDSEIPAPELPDIPGGSEAVTTGAISFTNPTWANGQASVTISTNTSYALQYQVVANEEASNNANWQEVPAGGIISNLNHRDVVYARLVQGTNYGEEATITIKDETPPIISNISTSNITSSSISVSVTAIDNETGIENYKFTIDGAKEINSTTGGYTFTGLSAETGYTIKVEVTDKAGNGAEDTRSVTTSKIIATNLNELEEGDYVYYTDGKGTQRECVVLYDSSSDYGVELITMESVEDVTLGDNNNLTNSINSYNNAISTLNSRATEYNNDTYSNRARCVGSNPSNPNSQSATDSYQGYELRTTDENYQSDWNKMNESTDKIYNINSNYWLGSRYASERAWK